MNKVTDVTDETVIEAVHSEIVRKFGRLDVPVNNAETREK